MFPYFLTLSENVVKCSHMTRACDVTLNVSFTGGRKDAMCFILVLASRNALIWHTHGNVLYICGMKGATYPLTYSDARWGLLYF